jgi:hypothetical protein
MNKKNTNNFRDKKSKKQRKTKLRKGGSGKKTRKSPYSSNTNTLLYSNTYRQNQSNVNNFVSNSITQHNEKIQNKYNKINILENNINKNDIQVDKFKKLSHNLSDLAQDEFDNYKLTKNDGYYRQGMKLVDESKKLVKKSIELKLLNRSHAKKIHQLYEDIQHLQSKNNTMITKSKTPGSYLKELNKKST